MMHTPKCVFPEPNIDFIKKICAASRDPSLKKKKYMVYLKEYKKKGLFCLEGKKMTLKRKLYYERIRKNKLEAFIKNNKKKIAKEKLKLQKERAQNIIAKELYRTNDKLLKII